MAENEKSWLERTYGPTWRSIKDPETYKSLLDLSSYGDVIDAPGAGEGLETLWSDYVAPWWSSYDELENPNWSRTKDVAKFNDACKILKDEGYNFETGTETVATNFLKKLYFRYSLTTDFIIWVVIPLLTLIWVF